MFFLLSNDSKIIETNQYAKTITGRHLIGENIQDLMVDFNNTFHLSALIKDPSKEHLLNISTASGLPQSFNFSSKKVIDQIGNLNTINASCVFMKHLVDDFLDVSAIEAGRFELDLQPAFIHEILANSLQLNKLQADKKGIGLLQNTYTKRITGNLMARTWHGEKNQNSSGR